MSVSKSPSSFRAITAAEFVLVAVAALGFLAGKGQPTATQLLGKQSPQNQPQDLVRQALSTYSNLPLSFEANRGQTDARVKFLARGSGYGLFLTNREAVLVLQSPAPAALSPRMPTGAPPSLSAIRLQLMGSNSNPQIVGAEKLTSSSNYLLGNVPRRWHSHIPQYSQVRYRRIYPGTDLIYYGRQQHLEYDFVVSPGADPSRIQFQVRGASQLTLEDSGDLLLHVNGGNVRLHAPRVYQPLGSHQKLIAGNFRLLNRDTVGFDIGKYDRARALVIDPQLSYSTYLGGTGTESNPKVAVDSSSNIYVTGSTTSTDFPLQRPFQGTRKGAQNIFISKLNAAGTALIHSTYLGGTGSDTNAGMAVDLNGRVFVVGSTTSTDFPTTSNAFQPALPPGAAGPSHVFASWLKADGSGLLYSTYLAGTSTDVASGMAFGSVGRIFVTGLTQSTNFPTTAGVLQPSNAAGLSVFFASKLDMTQSGAASLLYSTYLGGSSAGGVAVGGGIAVDSGANAYVTGGTSYTNFPVVNALQPTLKGGIDAFVTKLGPAAAAPPLYSTFLGGSGDDIGNAIVVDTSGNAYIAGSTTSGDFPVAGTAPFQSSSSGGTDAFLTKVSSNGTSLVYSTYLGGSAADTALALTVNAGQDVVVAGSTQSSNFKTTNSIQGFGGSTDAFVARFNTTGQAEYSSFLGGSADDRGTGVALNSSGSVFVAGDTSSANFPLVHPFQGTKNGATNAFVSELVPLLNLGMTATVSPNPVGVGNPASFAFVIKNNSTETATGVTFTDTLPTNGGKFITALPSQGACAPPSGTPLTLNCNVGSIAPSATATVTVQLSAATAGQITTTGTAGTATASATTTVTDFTLAVNPASVTVAAGQAASYTVTVSPVPSGATFTDSVSLSCPSGFPPGAACNFTTNPLTPNASPVTSTLVISTTVRGTTATNTLPTGPGMELRSARLYAIFFPLGGILFLGFGMGGLITGARGKSGKRGRAALRPTTAVTILMMGLLFGLLLLQPACGGSNASAPAATGTPAGSYNVVVQGASGTVTHDAILKLIVQ